MSSGAGEGNQPFLVLDLDQCSGLTASPPPPPPPPQPPPPPPPVPSASTVSPMDLPCNSKNENKGPKSTSYDTFFSCPQEEAKKAYQIFIRDKKSATGDTDSFIFISSYQPVRPVIQNGPLCGMVALSMATDLLNGKAVLTDEIFAEAKNAGYSLQGEMFSAYAMKELAAKFVHTPVELMSLKYQDKKVNQKDEREILSGLIDGHSLLIPYDADKNHGPCLANGHKAHWALVTGFFAAFAKSSLPEIQQKSLERDKEISALYHLNGVHMDETLKETLKCLLKSSELFVFAHQGKSKFCGVWKFDDLLSSNNNLFEADPERHPSDYIIPARGIGEELRAKVIVIHNQRR